MLFRSRLLSVWNARFWFTQALVILTVVGVSLAEQGRAHAVDADTARLFTLLRAGALAFAFVPVLYSALTFGLEGGILTTLWLVVLVGPVLVLGAPGDLDRFIEPAILGIVLVIGTILALRVQEEREARQRAEALSVRLSLLHEVLQADRKSTRLNSSHT